ncbi:hypothetical protein FACS189450_05170 [Spirochaetia bacterium]|nr:hypothetical protein FACS189450_05170 [Spirochaetia bacterium]
MTTTQIQPEAPMTFEQIREMFQETGRLIKETRESQEETDREIKETARVVKEVSRQLGGMGNSNGAFAENYFANALSEKMMFAGLQFDEIEANMKGRQGALRDGCRNECLAPLSGP